MTRTRRGRAGFTLIEMLVVMALMIVLAALTVAVANSGIIDSQRVVGAADRASGWLLIAKQRAKRDGAPRGVRFFVNPATNPLYPNMVTEAQYIEAPDPWVPNPAMASNPTGARIVFEYVVLNNSNQNNPRYQQIGQQRVFFVSGGTAAQAAADLAEFDQRVNVGDYLVLPEFGTSYLITGISKTPQSLGTVTDSQLLPLAYPATPTVGGVINGNHGRELTLNTDPNATKPQQLKTIDTYPSLGAGNSPANANPPNTFPGTYSTYQFAFQSASRPLLGEPTLQLTGSTVIDYRDQAVKPTPLPTTTLGVSPVYVSSVPQYFDILFSPTGQVLYNSNPLIALWVRNPDKVSNPRYDAATNTTDPQSAWDAAGDQSLVVVYPRTGAIATHPVCPPKAFNPAPPNPQGPYQFAKDGINSGL